MKVLFDSQAERDIKIAEISNISGASCKQVLLALLQAGEVPAGSVEKTPATPAAKEEVQEEQGGSSEAGAGSEATGSDAGTEEKPKRKTRSTRSK